MQTHKTSLSWAGRKTNLRIYFCLSFDLPGQILDSLWHCDPWLPGPGQSLWPERKVFAKSLMALCQSYYNLQSPINHGAGDTKFWEIEQPDFYFTLRNFPEDLHINFLSRTVGLPPLVVTSYRWFGNGTFDALETDTSILNKVRPASFEGFKDGIFADLHSRMQLK